jgi:Zn-dependent M28 family amino/carboxypeptidase
MLIRARDIERALVVCWTLASWTCQPLVAQRARVEAPAGVPGQALSALNRQMLEAKVRFLADDLLEGRAAGTRGGDLAARYLAAQFAALGLKPGSPDGSFYQWVSLAGTTPEASIVIGAQRRTLVLDEGTDYLAWPERADSAVTLDAEIAFAGYGITAPEWGWDDYQGTAQTGHIVMVLPNEPGLRDSTIFRGGALTSYGSWTYKLEQASRMGAVGVLLVYNPETVPLSWEAVRSSWSGEHLLPDRPPLQSLRFAAWITADAARRIVEATGKDYGLIVRRAGSREFRPLDLGARGAVDLRSRVRRFRSPNVLAQLEGTDSIGRRETVVVTAHYDHLGIRRPAGAPGAGADSIYHGAVDNASGVSVLLATASALARTGAALRRTVLFLAPTASEAGWLGTQAYLAQPAVPLDRTIAVINLDGANLWGPTRDASALGAEWSTLGDWFTGAARAESLQVRPDPHPQLGEFYSTDQLWFARAGVPALLLRAGTQYGDAPASAPADPWLKYLSERYHRSGDQVRSEFDYGGAVQQARLLVRLIWSLASSADFPTWLPGSEFRAAGQRLRPPR